MQAALASSCHGALGDRHPALAMSKSETIVFDCPRCEAEYTIVSIEAPRDTPHGKIACALASGNDRTWRSPSLPMIQVRDRARCLLLSHFYEGCATATAPLDALFRALNKETDPHGHAVDHRNKGSECTIPADRLEV